MQIIAKIETDFEEKFGIPRQSGLIRSLRGRVVMEPKFRNPDAFRGIEGYDYLWLLWKSGEERETWSATVKPPRLGGNKKMGVFATRSPFRPNPICLSLVRLESYEVDPELGPVLYVSGADTLNGTEIYDIKPYLPYADARADARGGFADEVRNYALEVVFPENLLAILPEDKRQAAIEILKQDPRPSYQEDPTRKYGTAFAGYDIRFHVQDGVLTVCEIVPYRKAGPG